MFSSAQKIITLCSLLVFLAMVISPALCSVSASAADAESRQMISPLAKEIPQAASLSGADSHVSPDQQKSEPALKQRPRSKRSSVVYAPSGPALSLDSSEIDPHLSQAFSYKSAAVQQLHSLRHLQSIVLQI